jgi:uncharacterized protein (DUF4415 family)
MVDKDIPPHPDPEIRAFEEALLRSIDQAKRGEFAAVHTPEMIAGYRARGRPAGSVQAVTKRPTTLRLDDAALQRWRASGKGWQTRAAEVLAKYAP